ncbi:MAG TPA: type II toxin-antitoxin system VapC family toxin [Vicinamibacterales bacterium]|nr:type II toxin-antitoxin system VapC family toxin [Vicinamibacterales bacterium]
MATRKAPRRPRLDAAAEAATASIRYIESSALLAALLEQDAGALSDLRELGIRVTSALTFAEASRALIRARAAGRITPNEERQALRALRTFERRCSVVAVTSEVLSRCMRPFPVEPIRTLDAVHLATVEMLGELPPLVTLVTRDERVRANGRALGYEVT